MNNRIAFSTLQKFLLGLGFSDRSVAGSHHWFERTASGTVLVYRAYQSGDIVSLADLLSTRKMLDETGVQTPEQFEQALFESSAA